MEEIKIKRVAIYARKSKLNEKSESCENQILQCAEKIKYLNSNPHDTVKYNIVEKFLDDGYSGKDFNRPGFKSLLEKVKNNEIDILLFYKLDRLSRNTRDMHNLIDFLNKSGVDLISIKERDIDTTTAMGKAFFSINLVFAQLERDLASERVKDNAIELAEKGQFMGSYVKYGYTAQKEKISDQKTKTTLEINHDEAKIVREIFNMYLRGVSYVNIANYLNDNNIPKKQEWNQPQKNGKWTESNMRNMLKDLNYVENSPMMLEWLKEKGYKFLVAEEEFTGGKSVQLWDKKITILNVAPIVSDETFIRVQKLKHKKTKTFVHTNPYQSPVLLSGGILKCTYCGQSLTHSVKSRKTKKGTREYGYYYCFNTNCINKYKTIKVDYLNNYVVKNLKEYYNNSSLLMQAVDVEIKAKNKPNNNVEKIKKIEHDISICVKRIKNLIMSAANLEGQEDLQELMYLNQQQITELKKKKELEKQLEELKKEVRNVSNEQYTKEELLSAANNFGAILNAATEDELKTIIHYLIKNIEVKDKDNIHINKKTISEILHDKNEEKDILEYLS